MTDAFSPDELAAAEALDRLIDETRTGRLRTLTDVPTAVVVSQLVAGFQAAAPPRVETRVAAAVQRAEDRARLPVRVAAFGLATVLAVEAFGNLFRGRWLAENLDIQYDSHGLFEGGVVFLALAAVIALGALRPKLLDVAALAGIPAGLALAVHGIPEFGEFPEGGLLHATQGVVTVAFAVLWWRWRRRYARDPGDEGEV